MLGGAAKQNTVLLLHLECCSGYVYLKARKHQIRVSVSFRVDLLRINGNYERFISKMGYFGSICESAVEGRTVD